MASPPAYTNPSVPVWGGGNKVKRDDPSSYSTAAVPPWGGGNKVKRDDPSSYSTAAVPPWGGGNKVKRDSPSAYEPPPVPSMGGGNKIKRALTITSSPSSQVSTTATATLTQAATPTTNNVATSTSRFPYTQMAGFQGTAAPWHFPAATIAAGNYNALCPHGNCLQDCQNMTRVFQALPDGINIDESIYGKVHSNGYLPDQTLFGLCSNLGAVSELAQTNYSGTNFASFFPVDNTQASLHNVSTDLSLCLFDTCQHTRDPTTCHDDCSLNALQNSNTSVSIEGMYPCLYRLCHNTCGLPYANQDVYGVGVLASYITQAILVLILAVVLMFFASWRSMKQCNGKNGDQVDESSNKFKVSRRMKQSLELFLATECYFGISAAIASYLMHPSTVDPLNGYALLSVSITGFIPTVFTLMLLHGHGVRSCYTTLLTFTSWLFSTVLFFMLVRNLSRTIDNSRAIDRGLDSLFNVDSCGQSSAMSLCKQAFDTDPLAYLSWFYNYWQIPSIKTVPVLWVLSTVVLLILVGVQTFDHLRKHAQDESPVALEEPTNRRHKKLNTAISLGSLYLGTILFGLALGYQACMVISYTRMDVIDWHGWSFGQVVALLFWVPPLINCVWSYMIQPDNEDEGRRQYRVRDHKRRFHRRYRDNEKHMSEDSTVGGSVSTDQLSFFSLNDKAFFSPSSDPSIYRAGSDMSDQIVRTPTDAVFGEFGQVAQRDGREDKKSRHAHASVRDVIIR